MAIVLMVLLLIAGYALSVWSLKRRERLDGSSVDGEPDDAADAIDGGPAAHELCDEEDRDRDHAI